ncbi:MAG: DEAD/DEAH box helicase [Firmicutes bacterium]|nr:DEAD/DEAH box helicase [Bacillota bacterium]
MPGRPKDISGPTTLDLPEIAVPDGPRIVFDSTLAHLLLPMRRREWDTWEAFLLAWRAAELSIAPETDLLTPLYLGEHWRRIGMIPYTHQLETARKVIREMGGRAILADEVGLGKTIEAGLIIKEYLLRGMIRRFLVLAPASLCLQWAAELQEKFCLSTVIARRPFEFTHYDFVVASLDTAKRAENRAAVMAHPFDLVAVDEAHKLKNTATQNWQFVNALPKRFFLLITATPLQNDLKELFNLITLLRPGQLGTYRSFRRHFVAEGRRPKNTAELKTLLAEVMIRNRRRDTLRLPPRQAENIVLAPSPAERTLYEGVTSFVREGYRRAKGKMAGLLPLLTLQREVCSSSFAAAVTLYKMCAGTELEGDRRLVELLELARGIAENVKMEKVLAILEATEEKVIVFTEFLATQAYIRHRLARAGIPSLPFDGHMSGPKRDYIRCLFRDSRDFRVLVSTESGGEGLNFQFCHIMINYDLPWNPMRLEQRIGRLHRLGQTKPVIIYNLSTAGTVEAHLLRLLQEKLAMFQTVLGELPRAMVGLGGEKGFEARLFKILAEANDETELQEGLEAMGEELRALLGGPAEGGMEEWL